VFNGSVYTHFTSQLPGEYTCTSIYAYCNPVICLFLNGAFYGNTVDILLCFLQVELHSLVLRCLEEASQHNVHSIAFPALGTGALGYPKDVVAETMYDAVRKSQKTLPTSSIKKVLFVVFHKDHDTVDVSSLRNTCKFIIRAIN